MHIMIDLETLSVRPDAAIIQIGAVLFEPVHGGKILNDQPFNQYVAIQDGTGSIDHDTLVWWLRQPNAKTLADGLENANPLATVLENFIEFPQQIPGLSWETIGGVWAKPSTFDLAVLSSAFSKFGEEPPWEHWKTRCAKTVFELVGGTPKVDETGLQSHDALDDAVKQAMQLQKAFSILKE